MKGLRTYRVFVSPGGPAENLKADGWKDVKGLSASDAALRSVKFGLSEVSCVWAYVALGELRHPNGVPHCVRGFEIRGKGSLRVEAGGVAS
jgi:hypothetical protein